MNNSNQKRWSMEETKILIDLFNKNKTNKEMAETLNRTYNSVAHRLYNIGLKRPFGTNQIYYGLPNSMTGKNHSQKTIEKIREKAIDRLKDRTKHPCWKGGERINHDGYVSIRMPKHPRAINGYIFEHILVMERILGRFLEKEECIHHINEIKADNTPENLMLFRNNADHQNYHAYMKRRKFFDE